MSNENTFNFEKLIVYQKSLSFIDSVYETTDKFPGLAAKLRSRIETRC
jgi:hypothetical protein